MKSRYIYQFIQIFYTVGIGGDPLNATYDYVILDSPKGHFLTKFKQIKWRRVYVNGTLEKTTS